MCKEKHFKVEKSLYKIVQNQTSSMKGEGRHTTISII